MADRTPAIPLSAVTHGRDGSLDPLNAVKYVAGDTMIDPTTPDERTARFEALVHGVGGGAQGYAGVLAAMEYGARSNLPVPGLHGGSVDRMHAAFDAAVRDGAWTDVQTKALVAAEVAHGTTPGQIGAVSGYLNALTGPGADATRATFARESIAAARGLGDAQPERTALLYAQAAQALGPMQPAALRATLDQLRAGDRDAVAKLTYGALGGSAELEAAHEAGRDGLETMPIAGVGQIVRTLSTSGAQSELVDAVHGVSQYLTEKRGTPAETMLLKNDAKTGLRDALAAATRYEPGGRSDFDALLRANRDASGLSTDGMNLQANLARVELGGSAHDATSQRYGETVGNVMGHLAADLARSTPGQDTSLQQDFGRHAFGNGPAAQQETSAARTLGNLVGEMREGLNQDFDVKSAAATARQLQLTSALGKIAGDAKDAAMIPGPQAEALKTFSLVVDHIKEQIPRDRTLTSEEAHALSDRLETSVKDLLERRPDLQAEFKNGLSDAATLGRDIDEHAKRLSSNKAAAREGGMIGRALRDVVALEPHEPSAPKAATAGELASAVREAVKEHNAHLAPHQTHLREPATDAAIETAREGSKRSGHLTGTLLEAEVGGQKMYFLHTGRGQYLPLDPVKDLHGIEPTVRGHDGRPQSAVNEVVDLKADGTIVPPQQAQHHQQPAHR